MKKIAQVLAVAALTTGFVVTGGVAANASTTTGAVAYDNDCCNN